MIHLTIDAENAAEMSAQLWSVAQLISGGCIKQVTVDQEEPKAVEVTVEPDPAPVQEPVQVGEPTGKQYTETEVRGALNAYRKAKGAPATRELLAQFGADSFPDLSPAKYAAVMDAVQEATNAAN